MESNVCGNISYSIKVVIACTSKVRCKYLPVSVQRDIDDNNRVVVSMLLLLTPIARGN